MKPKLSTIFSCREQQPNETPEVKGLPSSLKRGRPLRFLNLSETEVVRHYTFLSTLNYGVDSGFYPLGSCTMKYNPKLMERVASLSSFASLHPNQSESDTQGILEIMYTFERYLCEIIGYDHFTLQPVAGAHGEHTGLLIIKAFHEDNGQLDRDTILIPDNAHGTNPASASISGFKVKTIPSDNDGNMDILALKKAVSEHKVSALMLTNPSTLGLFEPQIEMIASVVHDAGGLLYYDGANANALLGLVRPGDMGFDVCHLNLHKTFATPHGGGGPGSGPVGIKEFLYPYLPNPVIAESDGVYSMVSPSSKSIGSVHGAFGNIGIVLRAFVYLLQVGKEGVRNISENALLNANYLQKKLEDDFTVPFNRACMHEFVISASKEKKEHGVSALDIAKRLIDYGFHPPTIYFPLIVSECLMIEPTETESKDGLDRFVSVMNQIKREIETEPELLKLAPTEAIVGRLNEAKAVKEPKLTFFDTF